MADYREVDTDYKHMWLHLDKGKPSLRNLSFQILFGGHLSENNLVNYYNIPQEKENKYLHRCIIYFSLLIQALLHHISEPLSKFGRNLEHFLNRGKGSDENSGEYFSFLGHLDSRIEMDKEIERGDGRYYPALTMMASKLAYESEPVIQSVISNHWKMESIEFYNFYNEFQKKWTTQAFIFRENNPGNDIFVVAFRGTSPFDADDWSTDFDLSWCKFKGMGKTHMGFMSALGLKKYYKDDDPLGDYYGCWPKEVEQDDLQSLAYYTIREKLREIMKHNTNAKFIVTGHSLGGALAILFPAILAMHEEWEILDRLEGIYTYGQPRVGDEKFGQFMMKKLRAHNIKYYRIVYAYDVVPTVPWDNIFMMFKHFGTCIHFNSLYHGKIVEEEREVKKRNLIEKCLWVVRDIALFIVDFILARLNAVWEVIRGFIIGQTAGPNFKEGWTLIVFRLIGIILPGATAHGPQDYNNATWLASEDLFLHYTSSMYE